MRYHDRLGPFVRAGNDRHPACLFAVVVGATAKGRKGTSYAAAREPCHRAFPELADRTLGGFGSGEKLIDLLADGKATDSRLLVFEAEFSRFLAVARRERSIASETVRNAWDGRRLENRSRAAGDVVASVHHVGFLGHIARDELAAKLVDGEVFNGFANRFLWLLARRQHLLPDGGNVPETVCNRAAIALRHAVEAGRKHGEMKRTDAGEEVWRDLYCRLADDEPGGLLAAATARDDAQCLRLSLLYALLDGRAAVDVRHIEAAEALWGYCRESARLIFGDALGDANADKLLAALKHAGPVGLDFSEQVDLFQRHLTRDQLQAVRDLLPSRGLATTTTEGTAGRSRSVTY